MVTILYKVLIVEDELEIRRGMLNHSIWHELGIEFVFDADDGLSGLEVIRQEPAIRLVITDIKMKRMSGMEFIQKLYGELSFTGKVIIISGYDDFQYARKAMNYGVIDYLLKPVNMTELKQVIIKTISVLEREEQQQYNLSMIEDVIPKLRENLLQGMIEHPLSPVLEPQLLHQLQQCNLNWLCHTNLLMMVLEADNLKSYSQQGKAGSEKNRILFAIGNVLEHSLKEHSEIAGSYVFFRSTLEDKWIVIFGVNPPPAITFFQWLNDFKVLLHARMKMYVKVSASIVVTSEGSLESLHALYEEALLSLTHIKIYGNPEPTDEFELEGIHLLREVDLLMEAKTLVDLLKHGEEQDVQEAIAYFPNMIREWGVTQLRDLHHRVFEWMLEIFDEARKAGWKQEEWRKNPLVIWEKIESFDTMEALQPQVLSYLLQVNSELYGNTHNQILQKAEGYIQDHFTEQITIQAVADYVFITPEWLSTLFKKHYGTTLLEYVTHMRIEKAKLLLQDISLKIYQISNEVGYKDTVYFSKLFKKRCGYTPKEFRNLKGIQIDD